jgi:hypothetical protein
MKRGLLLAERASDCDHFIRVAMHVPMKRGLLPDLGCA